MHFPSFTPYAINMFKTGNAVIFFLIHLFPHLCFSASLLEKMSLEEKVGQLLIVHFHGEIANEEARTLIQEINVGGIIYYNWCNSLHSPEQIRDLSQSLQKLAENHHLSIPLLIAVDQEGGSVARLKNGFTHFPDNKTLGETENPSLAETAALIIGTELQAVGINTNFAPVVDVNSNPYNPVIGARSFGEDPVIVTAFGKKALNGYKQAGIIATLKHFPGHGDTFIDSHIDLPILHKSIEELQSVELFPFIQLAPLAEMIMTAHLYIPALDDKFCSTLSKRTLNYLKQTIGFQGVVISDSLVMEGLLKTCSKVDEAAIQALDAGCDLLLLGGKQLIDEKTNLELNINDIRRIHSSLIDAITSGRISENRLNEAVEKILRLKQSYAIRHVY